MTRSEIDNKKPRFMDCPVADNGDHTDIPATSESDAVVNIKYGFPSKFSDPRANSGKSVSRADMNGILHYLSAFSFYFQYMGVNPWVEGHGYPNGAKVWYNGDEYVSSSDNNTSRPGSDDGLWQNAGVHNIDLSDIYHMLDELSDRVRRLESSGGQGGAYDPVSALTFASNITNNYYRFPDPKGVTPTCRYTDDDGNPVKLQQASRVNVVGCKFSMDPTWYTATTDQAITPFMRWTLSRGANYGCVMNGALAMYRNAKSGSYCPAFTYGGVGDYDTPYMYPYLDNSGDHHDSSLWVRRPGATSATSAQYRFSPANPMTQPCETFEIAANYGIYHYKFTGYKANADDEPSTISFSWCGYYKADSTGGIQQGRYWGSSFIDNGIYVGGFPFRYNPNELKRGRAFYDKVLLHEIFIGYLTKHSSSSSSSGTSEVTEQLADSTLVKTYRYVPAYDQTSHKWAWRINQVVDGVDSDLGIVWAESDQDDAIFAPISVT